MAKYWSVQVDRKSHSVEVYEGDDLLFILTQEEWRERVGPNGAWYCGEITSDALSQHGGTTTTLTLTPSEFRELSEAIVLELGIQAGIRV